ncbi:high-potential iron-sulfur protein [Derxia gummosa]|uniref:High-potential iron-sulfur protein n=1 Tax=Derxia gummosa DSM 723 TaxID=1121388 RepID=A0A8B6X5F7_9BURK|nr:high-potential iron-sulfur protein [Derxia gummosa]
MSQTDLSRRQVFKMAGALAAIPVIAVCGSAHAASNAAMRNALKYVDQPGPDGKHCAICIQFVPGAKPTDKGGCNAIPGDTEISPNGYCGAFVQKK